MVHITKKDLNVDNKDKITCEAWEGNEYIICINNKPTGMTVTKNNGEVIKEWLQNRAGLSSIRKLVVNVGKVEAKE